MEFTKITKVVIKELSITRAFRMFLQIAWIHFSVYMFNENPLFFSITSLLALVNFLADERLVYTIDKECLEVKTLFPISYFNKVKSIEFSQIKSMTYHEAKFDWIGLALSLVGPFTPIIKENRFEIKFLDDKVIQFRAVASSKENMAMLNFIEARINWVTIN